MDVNARIEEQLKSHNIRPSYQRVRIYEYVQTMKNHPTIDVVYSSLVPEIPTLSKTTIYNTLKLFVDAGIMQPVTIEDHEIRYDADTTPHIHFKCIECGGIIDVFIPGQNNWLPSRIPSGYEVREQHLYARGLCPECREEGRPETED